MRLLGWQIMSQGAAFGPDQLDAYQVAFFRGYFGAEAVPTEQLRVYQLLILLDKWSAAVRPPLLGSPRRRVHVTRQRWSDRYFRREARRLLSVQGSG